MALAAALLPAKQVYAETGYQWQQACQGNAFVQKRAGSIAASELLRGMSILHRAGLLGKLTSLQESEACLSMIGSASVDFPVLVAEKRLPDSHQNWSASAINRLSDHLVREQLAERLATLNINIASSQPVNADLPEREILQDNRATLYGAANDRSFAVAGPGMCTLALDSEGMPEALPQKHPLVWNLLGQADQQAIAEFGDAMEFWHEVGHCHPENVLEQMSSENTGAAKEIQTFAKNKAHEAEQCSTEFGHELLSVMETELAVNSDNPTQALNNVITAGGFKESDTKDHHVRIRLLMEGLSDAWAKRQVKQRGLFDQAYCGSPTELNHPWDRLRLAWSIREPDARYMTWLLPWIEGLPEGTQYQVLADAYEGIFLAAEKSLPKATLTKMLSERRSRPDIYGFRKPLRKPDADRSNRWKAWALANLKPTLSF